MAFYQLLKTQKLPVGIDIIWDFISSPHNLKEITPKHMGFEVTSHTMDEKMYPGMIITYKVSPILGIKLNWMTEITHVRDKEYFVDEQRSGPYTIWHHEHRIEPIPGGVLMTDLITYQPPFGILGIISNKCIIQNQLEYIFEYRREILENKFGTYKE